MVGWKEICNKNLIGKIMVGDSKGWGVVVVGNQK